MKIIVVIFCVFFLTNQIEICHSIDPVSVIVGVISAMASVYQYFNNLDIQNRQGRIHFLQQLEVVDKIEDQSRLDADILKLLKDLPNVLLLNDKETIIGKAIRDINRDYREIKEFKIAALNNTKFSDSDITRLYDKASRFLDNKEDSPIANVETIAANLFSSKQSVLAISKERAQKDRFYSCSDDNALQSLQSNLHQLLSTVTYVYLKAYMAIEISREFLLPRDNGTESQSFHHRMNDFDTIFRGTVSTFKDYLKTASRDVWRCDPEEHEEGETFRSLHHLFQMQVSFDITGYGSEVLDQYNDWSAYGDCTTYNDLEVFSRQKYEGYEKFYHYGRTCPGKMYGCKNRPEAIDQKEANTALEICHSAHSSPRLFENMIVTYKGNSVRYGTDRPCGKDGRVSTIPETTFGQDLAGEQKTCFCICDVTHARQFSLKADRRVYLGYSFINSTTLSIDHVVVGAQLASSDGIMYVKIKIGKLLRGGVIDTEDDPPRWLDIKPEELKKNVFEMDWNQRTIEVADLDVPEGHMLTGFYFKVDENKKLKLGVLSKKYFLELGSLDLSLESHLTYTYGTHTETHQNQVRENMDIRDMRLPSPGIKSNKIKTNVNMNFTISSFKYDMSQTTIPLLDIQEVTTDIPTPMTGAGLYYKYREGYAGYLGIKLKTFDVSKNMEITSSFYKNAEVESFIDKLSRKGESRLPVFVG